MAGTKQPGVRESQKQNTQKNVLEAALNVFAERGYEAASIRDIATRAGVNHGLIKYHFQGKEALWKAAVDHLFARLDAEMSKVPTAPNTPPEEALKQWVQQFVRYCADHPEHAQIMNHESIRGSERLKWVSDEHILPRHKIIAPIIERVIAPKKLKTPTFAVIYMLNAAMQAPFTLRAELQSVHNQNANDPEFVAAYADAVYAMFFESQGNQDD